MFKCIFKRPNVEKSSIDKKQSRMKDLSVRLAETSVQKKIKGMTQDPDMYSETMMSEEEVDIFGVNNFTSSYASESAINNVRSNGSRAAKVAEEESLQYSDFLLYLRP